MRNATFIQSYVLARNRFHDHVNKLVTKHRKRRKNTDATLLVDVLIDSTNDEEEILHDAVTFPAAGSHTTGSCNVQFTSFMTNLSQRLRWYWIPPYYDKLSIEINIKIKYNFIKRSFPKTVSEQRSALGWRVHNECVSHEFEPHRGFLKSTFPKIL